MQQPEKVRAAFERDLGNKVLFIKGGKLLFIDGINLKAIADRKAYFASLRARQAQPIVVLAELGGRGIRPVEAACAGRHARVSQRTQAPP